MFSTPPARPSQKSRSAGSFWGTGAIILAALAVAGGYGMLRTHAAEPVATAPATPYDPASATRPAPAIPNGTVPMAKPSAAIPQSALDAAFDLSVDLTRPHLPAELIVLPSRAPVVLRADVKQDGALPDFFRETKREYRWTTNCGKMLPADAATSPGESIFMPPDASERVIAQVEAEITLERPAAGGGTENAKVVKSAQLQMLAPVSSEKMKDGMIDGFDIGEYLDPSRAKNPEVRLNKDHYQIPECFYKVTPEIKSLKIAPDMTLGFWVIDFPWKSLGKTQYIALDMHLVEKLHDLAEAMRADGYTITQFKPIYGFRPPAFNMGKIESEAASTLKVVFSMHQYGRAADIIVDENNDNIMDDLNHDGKIDVYDAMVILKYVNRLDRKYMKDGRMDMVGGAGVYTHTDFLERAAAIGQTPYIHVDTRGFAHDDGEFYRWMNNNEPIPEDPPAKKAPSAKP